MIGSASFDFTGAVALVTGGAGGIGRSVAQGFLDAGARVVIADIDSERGTAWATERPQAEFIRCDVSRSDQVAAMIDQVLDRYGQLDVAVGSAGQLEADEGLKGVSEAGFDRAFHGHALASLLLIQNASEAMSKAGRGCVLTLTSPAAELAGTAPILYSSAKAAVSQMTRIAALRLASQGVRINAIQPGIIPTGLFGRAMGLNADEAERKSRRLKRAASQLQPLARAGTPEDVAKAALFLASDAAEFITGETLVVDGGFRLQPGPSNEEDTLHPLKALFGLERDKSTLR